VPKFTAKVLSRDEGWALVIDATEPLGSWVEDVAQRVFYLLSLPEGWDSYGARRVNPDAITEGLRLLGEAMSADEDIQLPDLTPGPNGEVQLGWYRGGTTLEIDISDLGNATAYFHDEATGTEWELNLAQIRQRLPHLVKQYFSV
jgi:hypothetical protein